MEKSNPYLKGNASLKRPREQESHNRHKDGNHNHNNDDKNASDEVPPHQGDDGPPRRLTQQHDYQHQNQHQQTPLNNPYLTSTTIFPMSSSMATRGVGTTGSTTTGTGTSTSTTTTTTSTTTGITGKKSVPIRNPYVKSSTLHCASRSDSHHHPRRAAMTESSSVSHPVHNNHYHNLPNGMAGHDAMGPTSLPTTKTTTTVLAQSPSGDPSNHHHDDDDDVVVVVSNGIGRTTPPPPPSIPTMTTKDAMAGSRIPSLARPKVWTKKDDATRMTTITTKGSAMGPIPACRRTVIMNLTAVPSPADGSRTIDPRQPAPPPQQQQQRPELDGEAPLPPELVYDPAVLLQPIKDEYRSQLTLNATLNEPLLNGWKLFGHQKRAILKGLMKRRLILALDMGLGKTLIGCVWARAFQRTYDRLKIFVICPTTLVTEWKRTAETATGLTVEPPTPSTLNPKKKTSKTIRTTTTTTTTTDSSLLNVNVSTWQKIPSTVDPRVQHYVVVFDEAHMMQSMESNRTQAALEFVTRDVRCVGTLLLTGTPMKNGKPSNMFPLLKAVQHPLGAHQRAFEKHFCEGHLRSFGGMSTWVANGQANLKQLHRMIEPKLLYMTKDEYLKELPPMSQETRSVPVSASYQKQYIQTIKVLANLKEAMKTNKSLSSESLLGAMSDVRIVCALAKVHATVEIAKEVLEVEPSIVIFATYQACVRHIAKDLTDCGHPVAAITGQTNPKERQALVDGFQNELYSAFVTTFGVGGVGITLTKARTVLFLDRPWTPGDILQAQDRIRRIGQEFPTRCISVSAFEFDVQLDKMLNEKKQASQAVLTKDGIASASGSTAGTRINIDQLAASLISRANLFG